MCLLRKIILLVCVVLINSHQETSAVDSPADSSAKAPEEKITDGQSPDSDVNQIYAKWKEYYSICPNFGGNEEEVEEFCKSDKYSEIYESVKKINSICLECSGEAVSEEEKKVCDRVLNFNLEGQLGEVCTNPPTKTLYLNYRECCNKKPDDVAKANNTCKTTISTSEADGKCPSTKYHDCVKQEISSLNCEKAFLPNFLLDISCNAKDICERYKKKEDNKDPKDPNLGTSAQPDADGGNSDNVNSDTNTKGTVSQQQSTKDHTVSEPNGSGSTVNPSVAGQAATPTEKPGGVASKSYELSTMAIAFIVIVSLRVFL